MKERGKSLIIPESFHVTEPGHVPIEPFPSGARGVNFLADDDGNRLRLRYLRREADGALIVKAWFGPGVQGPPGHAHGGSIASLLDEVMGGCAWMGRQPVVAAKLVVEFRNMLPLGTVAIGEGRIERQEGRKIFTQGSLRGEDGTLYAEGEGLFIQLKDEQLEEFRALLAGSEP